MPTPSKSFLLHRWRWKLAAGATVLALSAASVTALDSGAATAGPPARVTGKATHTVTLITGDKVTVTTVAGGKQIADVERPATATGGVRILESGGDLMVLPDEALALLAADKLDRRLFNVTDLIEMGYDDAKSSGVPLIATYEPVAAKARGAKPSAPRGSKLVRELAAVSGAALRAEKTQAREFWTGVAPAAGTTLGNGVRKIWLDGKVKPSLKESVPLIGAQQAWAAGYTGTGVKVAVLDTGIDATHPDLAGQIDDKVSFVPGEDTADINGHGTHVASTIVGTGAASNGENKGVAPGADLIVGKVLGGVDGFGEDSWVIAGMQWAAESGADIISMSLGNSVPSDGSDPLSEAVNNLTAQYGSLFVIAAGNSGPETISGPGAAASALTVGATDKADNLAYFSGTGPLTGSGALKPDLTAPGVDINAAWSQQAASYDGPYKSISGTSMATPHVSGAAAILMQQHPQWTWQQVKDQLTSSAKALAEGYSPYDVGTGRLDVVAAMANPVQTTGSLFFGNFDWPHEPGDVPVTKPLTFTNHGASAVTLNLAFTGSGPFTLGGTSVTVPAGGNASVNVTGDPTGAVYGRFAGYIVGTDAATGAALTRTSVGMLKEEERYDLRIKLVGRDGKPASSLVIVKKSDDYFMWVFDVDGERSLRLPPGTYSVITAMDVPGEKADRLGLATLVDPETILNRDSEVVLDARKARLVDTVAPQESEVRQSRIGYEINYADGNRFVDNLIPPIMYDDLYLSPTEKMSAGGRFAAITRQRAGEEMLSVTALGLLDFDTTVQPGSTQSTGAQTLRTVFAGNGAEADYAKLNARGKAVVVNRSDAVTPAQRAAAAVAAGAKLLIVVHDGVGVLNEYVGEVPITVATVHRDAGAVLAKLAKVGFPIRAKQAAYTSFIYDLTRNYPGNVPNRALTYKPSQRDLARVDARYLAANGAVEGGGFRYDLSVIPTAGFAERQLFPSTRVEWVTPGQVWSEYHMQSGWTDTSNENAYAKGTATTRSWFAPVTRPAFSRTFAVQNGRMRDYMTLNVHAWTPSDEGVEHGGYLDWGSVPTVMKLYQGENLIRQNDWASDMQWVEVPAGKLPYHLVLDASRPADQWRLTTSTHTEWDFISESNSSDVPLPLTLLQADFQIATDLNGDVKAGSRQTLGLKIGPQAGGSGTGRVSTVSLELSYDDGVTWQKVNLVKLADGSWRADVKLEGAAGGFVSLRTAASTDAGWGIKQEVTRAFGLY